MRFFLIIKIKIILRGINKTRPSFPNSPILKASWPEKPARITCAISCKLVPDQTPNTSGDIVKQNILQYMQAKI